MQSRAHFLVPTLSAAFAVGVSCLCYYAILRFVLVDGAHQSTLLNLSAMVTSCVIGGTVLLLFGQLLTSRIMYRQGHHAVYRRQPGSEPKEQANASNSGSDQAATIRPYFQGVEPIVYQPCFGVIHRDLVCSDPGSRRNIEAFEEEERLAEAAATGQG